MKKDMKAMACKKPVSVVMASAMALAMTPAMAMAAPTSGTDVADTQVTINGLLNGDKVEAFLIADADIDAANNLSYTFNPAVPAPYNTIDGLTAITSDGYTFTQGTDMQKAAGKIAAAIATGANAGEGTAAGTTATLNLGSGYYLVRVTSTSGDARVYQNMVIDVSPKAKADGTYDSADPVKVTAKQTPVEVTKGVGTNYEHKTDLYKVGDTVPFKVTTAIPNYPNDSKYATFIIGDKPTAGLEIDTASIQINGKDAATCDDYTLTADKTGYSIEFKQDYILAHPGESIEVTYNAKLTSAAFSKSETDVTGNTATVTFNPNPYKETTVTPDDKTVVQTYGYVFPKVGGTDQKALAGAVFTLYDAEGKNVINDENGKPITSTSKIVDGVAYVWFEDLAAGTYTAKETTVPAGYLQAPDQQFTLSAAECTNDNPATTDITESNYKVSADKVVDPNKPTLPVTGGAGTFALTATGLVLVAGASTLIVMRRRKEREQA